MEPPGESGHAPASDQTTGNFDDKTTVNFGDQTTPSFGNHTTASFSDQTSVTPLLLPRAKIVLWGDSLTQTSFGDGWGSQLADRYQRRADIINRGMSGYNTTWYLQLPDENMENVALCTIWFGANDAALEEHNPHHFVSLENYEKNLKILISKAKTLLKTTNLLLITAPPVHHEQRFAYQKQRYGPKATGILERTLENSGKYAKVCESLAKKLNLPCVNLWDKFQSIPGGDWSKFLSDGLHFSKEGHDFVFKCLMEAIEKHYPELVVTPCPHTGQPCNSGSTCEGLQTFGPYHDQIDAKKPDVAMKQAFKDLAAANNENNDTNNQSSTSGTRSPSNKKPKMDAP